MTNLGHPMQKILFSILFLISSNLFANELENNGSPYLALHGSDPVNWRLLNPKLLKESQETNKLLYISSGYYSCHWCHVMQKESYKDKDVAKFLNEHFIAIKIDRELEPALDKYLIDFVIKTRGNAGWPLNVFITPEGYPLLGLTYLPKDDFLALLTNLQKQWKTKQVALEALARDAEQEQSLHNLVAPISLKQLKKNFVQVALRYMDDFEGGFGSQNKFPMVANIEALMQLAVKTNNKELKSFIELTLNKMAFSGLRDPLNGGFFRYTVDPSWQTPHFEKMLYDNAQLIKLYLLADKVFPNNNYKAVALDTIAFVNKTLAHKDGGFISSLTADDNKQVEGGFYLWKDSELKKLLTKKEYDFIKSFWSWNYLEEAGDHLSYPTQKISLSEYAKNKGLQRRPLAKMLNSIKPKLITYQQKNHTNPKDDKRLSSWNALYLEALSYAAEDKVYLEQAKTLKAWIDTNLYHNNVYYHHANHKKNPTALGTLEDYAYLAKALLRYQRYDASAKQQITTLINTAWETFYKDKQWHASQHIFLPGQVGFYKSPDKAIPSAEATLILTTKHFMKDNKTLSSAVKIKDNSQTENFQKQIFGYATYLLDIPK